jgi:Na+/H+-translocating membrane pyrophosphatase
MTIEWAMIVPIVASAFALVFTYVLYSMLAAQSEGPQTEEDVKALGTQKDHKGADMKDKELQIKDDLMHGKCPLSVEQQIEIGNKMKAIADEVQEGAKAFLREEYFWLSLFVIFMFCVLLVLFTVDDNRTDRTDGIRIACCFLLGAILSATAGWIGMQVATDANIRTTQAARSAPDGGEHNGGLNNALRVAFNGGAVMGFVVVGLGLAGVSILMVVMSKGRDCTDYNDDFIFGSAHNDLNLKCDSLGMMDGLDSLAGFGFGASSIALFARVAGGIYTKAADVGADLVGKVEEDIPEDSPENPATIADNVGDNVGDVAGMGADLFESFVGSIIACATLANGDIAKISFPFWLAAGGIIASMAGYFCVRIGEGDEQYHMKYDDAKSRDDCQETMFEENSDNLKEPYFKIGTGANAEVWRLDQKGDDDADCHRPMTKENTLHLVPDEYVGKGGGVVLDDTAQQAALMNALHKGTLVSSVLVVGIAAFCCWMLLGKSDYQTEALWYYPGGDFSKNNEAWRTFGCCLIGLLCGILIGLATEYCTSYSFYPVKSISKAGTTGPATVIIQGLGVGMMSCFPPTILIVATILACDGLMSQYGVAVSAVAMLSTLGVTLATDAYGPVADNAGGLAEMVEELPASVRRTTDALDALGNTTAATGKGFAIGSAVLTSVSLLNAFKDKVQPDNGTVINVNVTESIVLAGIVAGSMLPFLFGALTMISVGLAAQELIRAVRVDFVDKKREEAAALNAANATYEPWEFTTSKYAEDVKDNSMTKLDYYQKSFEGRIKEPTARRLQEFTGLSAETVGKGLNTVQLHGVVKVELKEEGKDGEADVITHRWMNFDENKHADIPVEARVASLQNAGAPAYAADKADMKANKWSDESWEERQSLFETKAWHHLRGWAPNSKECIKISTRASIREMLLPGVYAIFFPVFIGFLVGARMLMGVLAGSVGSGAMLAIMMSNAGGAWDNSKKYIEIAGAHGGKGTEIHKACVVGDTVGDPFKDTSGPALNILLKLMAMVSLTISTLLKGQDDWEIGWWAFIPGLIMVAFTFIYIKYIYNSAETQQQATELIPVSARKQVWDLESIKGPTSKPFFGPKPTGQV